MGKLRATLPSHLSGGLVVDLGCGSGILAARLAEAGFEVYGVDASPAMVELARGNAPSAQFVVGSLRSAAIPECVAVTAVGEALGYMTDESDAWDPGGLFPRIHDSLAPGGLLIFDVVERSAAAPMRYRARRTGDGWRVEVEVDEDSDRCLVTRRIDVARQLESGVRRSSEVHIVRTFEREELETALVAAGFTVEVTRSYGSHPLPPQRLGFVARKSRG